MKYYIDCSVFTSPLGNLPYSCAPNCFFFPMVSNVGGNLFSLELGLFAATYILAGEILTIDILQQCNEEEIVKQILKYGCPSTSVAKCKRCSYIVSQAKK